MRAEADAEELAGERAAAREALFRLRRMQPENCEYEGLREFVIGEHMSYARFLARRYRLRGEQLN